MELAGSVAEFMTGLVPFLRAIDRKDVLAGRLRMNDQPNGASTARNSPMPNNPDERLDRRDFMIASVATIGASAALAAHADSASARDSVASAASPTPVATSGTVYTGEVIQGKKVVSALDVNDLEPGQKHLLFFQGGAGAHRTALVCVCDRRQGGETRQACRIDKRCAWRRDEFHSHRPDRDEPARSGEDVGHGHGGHRCVPPSP